MQRIMLNQIILACQNLSNLIWQHLLNGKKKPTEITPLVESLSGVINLDEDFDVKDAYTDYLIEKYKWADY